MALEGNQKETTHLLIVFFGGWVESYCETNPHLSVAAVSFGSWSLAGTDLQSEFVRGNSHGGLYICICLYSFILGFGYDQVWQTTTTPWFSLKGSQASVVLTVWWRKHVAADPERLQ